ncbi:MAG: hypothetical protein CL484_06875 [Acidobacteria bacterium]|nr:hypothetical protein [Acidobacteriota bacterium]|tara:strand:+ start:2282 stop:2833 length:552 start_codon:yes stop_codon:yes gene_type:complete
MLEQQRQEYDVRTGYDQIIIMLPTTDWAPNIHPLLVHFPISILLAATLFDFIGCIRPSSAFIRDSATWLYCAGGFLTLAAYFSGLDAASGATVSFEAKPDVSAHFRWADRTTWFFIFFASLRLAISFIWQTTSKWVRVPSFLVSLIGLWLLIATFELGGRLVFQHGLGVSSVPATGGQWTIER